MTLQEHVKEAIQNAIENGDGPTLEKWTDEQLTDDLMDCDADIAKFPRCSVLAAVGKIRGAHR